ncbi:MAG: hypothetical protein JO022_12605, partial [Acidobacteriaceae bacterium]|nr:hypothetical protein [Acidobacteriaceae bacterium]
MAVAPALWINKAAAVGGDLPRPDRDNNGIPDSLELRLANLYAPVLFYSADEPNLPTRVDAFLKNRQLWFYGKYCVPDRSFAGRVNGEIPRLTLPGCRAGSGPIDSYGTWSADKSATFYLNTGSWPELHGSIDPANWVTYVHSYWNELGGITLQYWRFYAFNTSYWAGVHFNALDHGGDWEAIHVVLGPGPAYPAQQIRLLGHRQIVTESWKRVKVEDGHPLILCTKGGHTS